MCLLIDMQRRGQWPQDPARLASLVGQTAVLAGLLHLMGPRDLEASRAHYDLALQAAREAEDWDLASYVLGSLAFLAMSAHRPTESHAFRDAAWKLALCRAGPRTRAWVAALASELLARDGDETSSRRFLSRGFAAMERTRDDPSWKGVGWFDEPRLAAYEGGNLVLLGQYSAAEELLRSSLSRIDPARVKHRCTLSADLAMALAHLGEIDEACARAVDALLLARWIAHQESIERVRGVHAQLLPWREHGAVRALTEQLQAH
jgi:tetratricopeptide (TPR) repeat protein